MPNLKAPASKLKLDLSLVPPVAIAHEAFAMMDGAYFKKYEPFNYRDTEVTARDYVAAAKRHIDAWLEREECAPDSLAHHLGHARACLGIILDAQASGCLIDNRPGRNALSKVVEDLNGKIKERHEKSNR